MIIEYAINPDPMDEGSAYILPNDLRSRRPVIYLGGGIDMMNNILKNEPHRLRNHRLLTFDNWGSYYEAHCERLITHEHIHITIFDLTDSMQTCRSFDNAEGKHKNIGSCGLSSLLDPKGEDET